MANRVDIAGYAAVLRVRQAWLFDVGGTLMRICQFTTTIGVISMLTAAGYSAFVAGTVASVMALALFLVAPRVSKAVDERGQRSVVPPASAVALAGLLLMMCTVALHGPLALCYAGAVLVGFLPSAPSLVRARWLHLLNGGSLGAAAPDLQAVLAYEGIIEDLSFMVGPAAAIALGAAIAPIAGVAMLAVLLVAGTVLLVASRGTEPPATRGTPTTAASAASTAPARTRSMFLESPGVRVLFFAFLLMSGFYGVLNTAEVTFTQQLGDPNAASVALMVASIISAAVGLVFGTLRFRGALHRRWMIIGALLGLAYVAMALISSVLTLYAVSWVGITLYAPFLITSNALCQHIAPEGRLTESLTWMNAGSSCGMAVGPTVAGACIDALGIHAGFASGAVLAAMLAVLVIATAPVWRRSA